MTTVYFSFDCEDYTNPDTFGDMKRLADILAKHNIKGNFNFVGWLIKELVKYNRFDVIDSMKNHTISSHTLAHSFHPTICEYTDINDFEEAYNRVNSQESETLSLLKKYFKRDSIAGYCPPGAEISYASIYYYADNDVPLFVGTTISSKDISTHYMCNSYMVDYDVVMDIPFKTEPDYTPEKLLDKYAGRNTLVLYNHPCNISYDSMWDMENYQYENKREYGKWIIPPKFSQEKIEDFYKKFEELIVAIENDDRFVIGDMDELKSKVLNNTYQRKVTKDMLPQIKTNLLKHFEDMTAPESLSVADCFYAAKHFMTSDEDYTTDKVHGFLYKPEGTKETVSLTADEVIKLSKQTDNNKFIQPYFEINGKKIGPADLLFAMLDVAMGAKTVTAEPKEQLSDYSRYPWLSGFCLNPSD